MKIARLLAASTILSAILALSVHGQGSRPGANATPPRSTASTTPADKPVPVSKIVFINTEAFGDEKAGIGRYVKAMQALQREFKPREDELNNLRAKLTKIATEIETLANAAVVDPKTIQAKQDEGAQLENQIKVKRQDGDRLMENRYEALVRPISTDIGKEVDAFAAQRGFTLVLDVSKLSSAILTAQADTDVTEAFIAYYNAKNP